MKRLKYTLGSQDIGSLDIANIKKYLNEIHPGEYDKIELLADKYVSNLNVDSWEKALVYKNIFEAGYLASFAELPQEGV